MKNLENKTTAAQIMNKPVVTIGLCETVEDAIRKMQERHVNWLVVEEDGFPVGLITRDLIISLVILEGVKPYKKTVQDLMTDLDTCFEADSDIRTVMNYMLKAGEDATVITEKDKIAGFISLGDIFRHIHEGKIPQE